MTGHAKSSSAAAAAGLLLTAALLGPGTAGAAPAVFARLAADREGIYRGEQFRLTLSVFTSGETLGRQIAVAGLPPDTVLSWAPFEEMPNESSVIEGRVYDVRRYRTRARALQAGPLRLEPRLQGTLLQVTRTYWLTHTQEQPLVIPVEPLLLDIRTVPESGRPAAFSGAIGTLDFSAQAAPLEVALGDLVTVTMTVSGEGVDAPFNPPAVTAVPGFKVYDVQPVTPPPAPDIRVFTQTVVPAEPSAIRIPAVAFTFFNPREQTYITRSAGPFPIVFHAERMPTNTVYRPPSTSAPSLTGLAAADSQAEGPGALVRAWQRLTGQRFAATRTGADTTARFAPASDAAVLFTLKAARRVRIDQATQGWVRIACREGVGWVPADSLKPE